MKDVSLSDNMKAVLHWLYSYPQVMIQAMNDKDRPDWTAMWMNDDAKSHMEMVMNDLGFPVDDVGKIKRDRRLTPGTPRITKPIFKGLLARGLIRATKRRIPQEGWSDMYYYQLTERGKETVTGLRLIAQRTE